MHKLKRERKAKNFSMNSTQFACKLKKVKERHRETSHYSLFLSFCCRMLLMHNPVSYNKNQCPHEEFNKTNELNTEEKLYLSHLWRSLILWEYPLTKIYRQDEGNNANREDKHNNRRSTCSNVKDHPKTQQQEYKKNTDIYPHKDPENLQTGIQ